MALAYAWVVGMGAKVARRPDLRSELTRGIGRRRSVFHLGLRFLTRWLELGPNLPAKMHLVPHVPIFPKTVVQ